MAIIFQVFIERNHQFQLKCIQGCKKCTYGIYYDDYPNGEMNIDGICYSIRSDENKIQFDGCFNCKFHQHCVIFF
ncbi:unnamed protein product [Paramecium primaurelia]|uniref:Uncharacterized protein n=1 Tax=Paramecium primaurelia TaxID=5886 RepID=A0A8S1QS06_PARPR|nr:unnamed protein product [Paramecium primaurelia]